MNRPGLRSMLVAGLAVATPAAAIDAFPGADGFGRGARGGRDGRIIAVTTLADGGPGSLRACIDAQGPRTCIFRVGGLIRFTTTRPIITNPFLTIAGQTAPGGGITLAHAGGKVGLTPLVVKRTHDIVIRHIRVRTDRRGDNRASNSGIIIEHSRDVIIDHVSTAWALDENIGGHGSNDRITISGSIFAEGIPRHDKCALLASHPPGPQRFSFVRNLCAHNGDRNPDVNFPPGSCIDVINNVLYNARSQFTEVWESFGGTPVNIVGNYYRRGPNTVAVIAAIQRQTVKSTGRARIYAAGNLLDGAIADTAPGTGIAVVGQSVCASATAARPAATAYVDVLASSGAFPRDAIDRRIIDEVRLRRGAIRSEPGVIPGIARGVAEPDTDGDGMPDDWERSHGTNPAEMDTWQDADNDGWPNFDEFLDWAHRRVLAAGPSALRATQRRSSHAASKRPGQAGRY